MTIFQPEAFPVPRESGQLPVDIPRSNVVRATPHFGHAAAFVSIFVGATALTGALFFLLNTMHVFGRTSLSTLQHDPLIVLPTEMLMYLITAGLCLLLFPILWQRSFSAGIHWRARTARRFAGRMIGLGVLTSIVVQGISQYLPMPKEMPIDEYFRTTTSVWLVVVLGVLIAPAMEELAFRGFLLPCLATAWDWFRRLGDTTAAPVPVDEEGQQIWSQSAMIFASAATSVPFAMMHAPQLAHAWAPLGVLFCVSLILCAARLVTRSLAASTLVHASYNFMLFLTMFYASDGFRHLDKLKG